MQDTGVYNDTSSILEELAKEAKTISENMYRLVQQVHTARFYNSDVPQGKGYWADRKIYTVPVTEYILPFEKTQRNGTGGRIKTKFVGSFMPRGSFVKSKECLSLWSVWSDMKLSNDETTFSFLMPQVVFEVSINFPKLKGLVKEEFSNYEVYQRVALTVGIIPNWYHTTYEHVTIPEPAGIECGFYTSSSARVYFQKSLREPIEGRSSAYTVTTVDKIDKNFNYRMYNDDLLYFANINSNDVNPYNSWSKCRSDGRIPVKITLGNLPREKKGK